MRRRGALLSCSTLLPVLGPEQSSKQGGGNQFSTTHRPPPVSAWHCSVRLEHSLVLGSNTRSCGLCYDKQDLKNYFPVNHCLIVTSSSFQEPASISDSVERIVMWFGRYQLLVGYNRANILSLRTNNPNKAALAADSSFYSVKFLRISFHICCDSCDSLLRQGTWLKSECRIGDCTKWQIALKWVH